ncbi:MAG: divalent-cation tolerance protein CutA [Anaerolineaceae bacterium]|jgi:periplasmic divalent cation tolerance protein|nr:MAG: divalent-cation tolerance protein CutA [Anaerolineaceae bacterium]
MVDVIQVTVTVPNEETGIMLANELVEKRLAACVQMNGPIRSVYLWKGKVEDRPEWMCIVKTTRECYQELEAEVKRIHPYEVPEIAAVPVVEGNPDYLRWVGDCVKRG